MFFLTVHIFISDRKWLPDIYIFFKVAGKDVIWDKKTAAISTEICYALFQIWIEDILILRSSYSITWFSITWFLFFLHLTTYRDVVQNKEFSPIFKNFDYFFSKWSKAAYRRDCTDHDSSGESAQIKNCSPSEHAYKNLSPGTLQFFYPNLWENGLSVKCWGPLVVSKLYQSPILYSQGLRKILLLTKYLQIYSVLVFSPTLFRTFLTSSKKRNSCDYRKIPPRTNILLHRLLNLGILICIIGTKAPKFIKIDEEPVHQHRDGHTAQT